MVPSTHRDSVLNENHDGTRHGKIESALMELVARHQVNVFSNKHFAGK